MEVIYEYLVIFLDLVVWTIIMKVFFCKSIKFNINSGMYILLFLSISQLFNLTKFDFLGILTVLILYPIFIIIKYEKKKKISKFFGIMLTINILLIPANMINLITKSIDLNSLMAMYITSVIFDVFIILLYKRKANKLHIHMQITKTETIFCIILNIISFVAYIILDPESKIIDYEQTSIQLLSIFIVISILCANLLFIILFYKNKVVDYYKNLDTKNKQYIEDELKYFQAYKDTQKNVKKFRHDIKNHLLQIHDMCENKKYKELSDYIEIMHGKLESVSPLYHVGNDTIDAILNGKLYFIQAEHIKFEVDGYFYNNISLTPYDLCTLFSNALDNAIEANMKIENLNHRYLKIQIKSNTNHLIVTFINPIHKSIVIENSNFVASDKKSNDHGFGLINMKETIERNFGYLKIYTTKNEFQLDIIFPC